MVILFFILITTFLLAIAAMPAHALWQEIMASLSMDGIETMDAGLNNNKKFGYLYILSFGWFANNTKAYAESGAYLKRYHPNSTRAFAH